MTPTVAQNENATPAQLRTWRRADLHAMTDDELRAVCAAELGVLDRRGFFQAYGYAEGSTTFIDVNAPLCAEPTVEALTRDELLCVIREARLFRSLIKADLDGYTIHRRSRA